MKHSLDIHVQWSWYTSKVHSNYSSKQVSKQFNKFILKSWNADGTFASSYSLPQIRYQAGIELLVKHESLHILETCVRRNNIRITEWMCGMNWDVYVNDRSSALLLRCYWLKINSETDRWHSPMKLRPPIGRRGNMADWPIAATDVFWQ